MDSARRNITVFGLLLALTLAGYAQYVIGKANHWADDLPLIASFDGKLTSLYRGEQSVAVAIPIFALAMALFAWSAWSLRNKSEASHGDQEPASKTPSSTESQRWHGLALVAGAFVALAGWSYLIARLATASYEGWYLALFFCLLALTAVLFGLYDRVRGSDNPPRLAVHSWECFVVLGAMGLFAGLVATDLTNWRYATLGDDGTFFIVARDIVNGERQLNLFSQVGPAGNHPLLSSAYQAAVMDVAGVNIFGWKLATLLLLLATIPLFYLLIRAMTNARTAVFATAVLAFSHYLLGYAHTGYDNVFPLLPTVLSFCLFVAGRRRSSLILIFCAGAVAGLGFYTFFSGRAAIVILALVLLFLGRKHWRPATVIPITAGFALAVAPLFAVEGWGVISETLRESQSSNKTPIETISSFAATAPRVFLAFNFNPYPKHFVSGSLLDDISAPLALLGLAYTATRVREERYRFLLIWFLVAIVVTGLFHPRQTEINSRLHYVLPPMAAFAGLALDRIVEMLPRLFPRPSIQPALVALCAIGVLPAILGLNIYRHWEVSPSELPVPNAALVLREAQRPACDLPGLRSAVFAPRPFPVMPLVFEFYEWEGREPLLFRFGDPPEVYRSAIASGSIGCVIVAEPHTREAQTSVAYLTELAEGTSAIIQEVSDASGFTTLLVLRLTK
ncbi:MAG: glycosyltransferase family 39 protein [Chloroflexi bacterium]|nr:glycosyltransferase family 39 protein [Chloroflexota bacterium]